MEALDYLHQLFSPRQPAARYSNVQYLELKPHESLRKFVHCFWQLRTSEALQENYNYRVVSDGCIDIFLNARVPSESFVMGFFSKFHTFSLGQNFNYIGIRFYPSIFPQLFDVSARLLANKVTALSTISEIFAIKIQEESFADKDLSSIGSSFDHILSQFLSNKDLVSDTRFNQALKKIFETNGVLETSSDLNTGLSPRQLRRVFNYYIGTTPKSFCKVVRFQYILNAKPSLQSLKKNKLYFDAGFYDQAHFIKDFKNFYGVTPSEAFR